MSYMEQVLLVWFLMGSLSVNLIYSILDAQEFSDQGYTFLKSLTSNLLLALCGPLAAFIVLVKSLIENRKQNESREP